MTQLPSGALPPGSVEFLAAIVESSEDAIVSKDLRGVITTWNPAAERIFGYTAAEAIGQSITMLIPEGRYDEEPAILQRIKRGERIQHYETIRRHKNGQFLEVELTVSPIRDRSGQIIGASKIARDISAQKRAQERFRVTLSSIGDAVIATDTESRIVFMNKVAEDLTGWGEREALGQALPTVFNIVNETTLNPVESPVVKVLREGTIQGLANHTILISKHGRQVPIDDSAAPIRSTPGELMGVVLVFRDVSERRAAQIAALRLAAIVEGSEDAIIGKNLRGIITSWNRGAERIFGYAAEEIIGQSILLLIPPDRAEEEPRILARLQRGERVEHFETIRVRKDGSEINVSLSISPIRNDEDEIIGVSKIARDITAQKNSERALRQAQSQLQLHASNLEREVRERTLALQETIAELDAFSYSLSHDLRAPLRAIQGFSEILLSDFGEKIPEGADYLRRIVKASERMDRLIRDVLTFSRMARAEIRVEAVDLEKIIGGIIHDRPELQPPVANITIETPLLPVLGHEASLVQCLSNLLANAAKFVAAGRKPEVRLSTRGIGDKVRVLVNDNGIGIDPAGQQRLFRMFERLPTDQAYEGTGIGLAIVRKAAERMHGRVGVESVPGGGSTFWLELPAVAAANGATVEPLKKPRASRKH